MLRFHLELPLKDTVSPVVHQIYAVEKHIFFIDVSTFQSALVSEKILLNDSVIESLSQKIIITSVITCILTNVDLLFLFFSNISI